MRRRDEQVLDEVVVLERLPVVPASAAPLPAVGGDRGALDVPRVRHGHDHVLLGDQVLDRELPLVARDLGAALVAELRGHVLQLLGEDLHPPLLRAEDRAQLLDERAHFLQLLLQLLDLEPGELGEAHVEDRLGLPLAQLEAALQLRARLRRVLRLADDLDHLVDVVDGDLEPLEDVLALERLVEVELRAADDHLVPVRDVVLEQLLEPHHLRHQLPARRVGDEREHDHAERRLHLRVLVELVQHHARDRVALELDHHPQPFAARLVPEVADPLQLAVAHQRGDVLDQLVRVDLVGHLGHHDLRAAVGLLLLDHRARAHHDPPAPGLLIVLDPRLAVDVRPGREVRPLDEAPQLPGRRLGVLDQVHQRAHHLAQVVRRNVRRHPDRDPRRPVHHEVREPRREHLRLDEPVVEVGGEVDGVLVDVRQHLHRDRHEPRFGVAVRGRRVPVHRPEVPLPVDERIAQREVLHHAHERIVHARVAVRVEPPKHVPHHRRRLLVRPPGHEPEIVHRVQHPPVHRLEPVAHVGERARHDHAHRVVDERFLDLLVDETGDDPFPVVRSRHDPAGSKEGSSGRAGRATSSHDPCAAAREPQPGKYNPKDGLKQPGWSCLSGCSAKGYKRPLTTPAAPPRPRRHPAAPPPRAPRAPRPRARAAHAPP